MAQAGRGADLAGTPDLPLGGLDRRVIVVPSVTQPAAGPAGFAEEWQQGQVSRSGSSQPPGYPPSSIGVSMRSSSTGTAPPSPTGAPTPLAFVQRSSVCARSAQTWP